MIYDLIAYCIKCLFTTPQSDIDIRARESQYVGLTIKLSYEWQ